MPQDSPRSSVRAIGAGPMTRRGGEMDRAHAGRPAGRRGPGMLLAAALLLVGQAEAPPARAGRPPATPVLSGLPWRSGATGGGFPCLARLRGRPLDAVTTYVRHDRGFTGMVAFTAGPYWRARARLAPLLVVSLPLLTDDTKGQ